MSAVSCILEMFDTLYVQGGDFDNMGLLYIRVSFQKGSDGELARSSLRTALSCHIN